jgi:hypothetical protein
MSSIEVHLRSLPKHDTPTRSMGTGDLHLVSRKIIGPPPSFARPYSLLPDQHRRIRRYRALELAWPKPWSSCVDWAHVGLDLAQIGRRLPQATHCSALTAGVHQVVAMPPGIPSMHPTASGDAPPRSPLHTFILRWSGRRHRHRSWAAPAA